MTEMIRLLKDASIEIDTDGMILDMNRFPEWLTSIDEVNRRLREAQHNFFGVPYDKMNFKLEFEGQGSLYMYKAKNYVLRLDEQRDKLTVKGVAFTGYDKAQVILRTVKVMSESIMRVGEYKDTPYHEAVRMVSDIRDLPLDAFKFSRKVSRNPSEYRGFTGISIAIQDGSYEGMDEKKTLTEMKSRARRYIDLRFKEKEARGLSHTGKCFKQLIKDCLTMEQMNIVLGVISESDHTGTASKYFMLNLMMKLKMRGHDVSEEDVIEYYYTKSSEQYSLAEDVTSVEQLDLERYESDVAKVVERFSFADPLHNELNLGMM
jgi:hypothetical protein